MTSHAYKVLGVIVAILAALSGHEQLLPAQIAFLSPWIELLGYIGGVVTAYLMIPAGAEKKLAIFLALAIGASSMSGCAFLTAKPGATPTADAAASKLHDVEVATRIVDKIGLAVKAVQSTEIAYFNGGKISAAEHVKFQGYLLKWADAMLTLKPALQDLTNPAASRQDLVKKAIAITNELIKEGLVPVKDENSRLAIRVALAQVEALLPTLELLIH